MGVITKLTIDEINKLIKHTNIEFTSIKQTKNGITDSTYIGTSKDLKRYIFKVFESSSKEDIENKIYILNSLNKLKVPRPISNEIVLYENKPTLLLSFIEGKISEKITLKELEEITIFISKLHSIKNIKTSSQNIYSKIYFEKMLEKIEDKLLKQEIIDLYKPLKNIDLNANSLIHGDLFPDNVKFINQNLSGVYDFAQACFGNSYFDLAVLIVSWCFEKYDFNKIYFDKIIEIYSKNSEAVVSKEKIKEYLLFACVYYSVQRITRENKRKDYKEFIIKYKILEKI